MEQEELLSKTYISALKFIAHKPRTVEEVRKKISGYLDKSIVDSEQTKKDVSDKVIELLIGEKYLDDTRYIREYLDVKTSSGKTSLRLLKSFLLRKGIDKQLSEKYLSEIDSQYETKSATELGRKKLAILKSKELAPFALRSKLYTYLLGKGYKSESVERAVDTLLGVK